MKTTLLLQREYHVLLCFSRARYWHPTAMAAATTSEPKVALATTLPLVALYCPAL